MACDLQLESKKCYHVQDFCEVIIGWNYKEYSVDEARVHELLSQTEPPIFFAPSALRSPTKSLKLRKRDFDLQKVVVAAARKEHPWA